MDATHADMLIAIRIAGELFLYVQKNYQQLPRQPSRCVANA